MKKGIFAFFFLSLMVVCITAFATTSIDALKPSGEISAREELTQLISPLEADLLSSMELQNNGRLKPFETFAKESVLRLTGKSYFWGFDYKKLYLGLILSPHYQDLPLLYVGEFAFRKYLKLDLLRTHFSDHELQSTPLSEMAMVLLQKQMGQGSVLSQGSLPEDEKNLLEVYHRVILLRQIHSGEHLVTALNISAPNITAPNNLNFLGVEEKVKDKVEEDVLGFQKSGEISSLLPLLSYSKTEKIPEAFLRQRDLIQTEVFYQKANLFWWSAILYLLMAVLIWLQLTGFSLVKNTLSNKTLFYFSCLPLLLHTAGFWLRILITGFSPVTNMYGTMLWVSFGVSIFGLVLFLRYQNKKLWMLLLLTSALVLFLTESFPLTLSPDMDPIVAVLRSNYWLTIHVLTITISYAAFTITMVIGNVAMIREIFDGYFVGKLNDKLNDNLNDKKEEFYLEYSHYAYRTIQLGCFLLTVGIILGGIWADYSWGRFWGWDPKETWALIADIGFLAILHSKFIGWVKSFTLLAWSTMAYLLVIMAWYGVNFVLVSGLHSYGFSSGGALVIGAFACLQIGIFLVAMRKKYFADLV